MSGSNSTTSIPAVETPTPSPTTPNEPPTTESTTTPVFTPPPETTTSSSTTTTPIPTPVVSSTTSSSSTTTIASTTPVQTPTVITSVVTQTPTESGQPPITVIVTSTQLPNSVVPSSTRTTTSSRTTSSAGLASPTAGSGGGGLNGGGKIAVAVVVPIVAVALLILAGIFFWRKRKQRKDAEELRRKEVEEYGYNPNNDPTLPAAATAAGSAGNDGAYEMREDGSSGYRGWGTTAVASSGRKASTTLSGPSAGASAGGIGMAYSEPSPSHDARSDNPLVDGRSMSPEGESLGAMGPAASQNRNGDIHRGPSNASSSYSAANRSDGSGDVTGYGGSYNNQYDAGNPYADTSYGSPPNRAEMSGQPVIRDVSARRNTRIENPSHFPQQSAGISQNF